MILDAYCKAGGAGMGYHRAGFDVLGVDIEPQSHYPFEFMQADALDVLSRMKPDGPIEAIHASPPCQAHTLAQRIQGNDHEDLIGPTRELLIEIGLPYVIENVPGAPLVDPIELCGCMFPGMGTYRPRLFECSFPIPQPAHRPHIAKTSKMGRPPVKGEFMHVVGNFSGVAQAREAMGIDWMTRDELREAIPPAYTEFVGRQLIQHLQRQAA